ncbi:MAG: trypsin-like peptidase domain-containing protein [Oscillospiraceae bacterium]|nr:trypsin-like peptidase domain-containing protein [Oscillospiraceae bacterium]
MDNFQNNDLNNNENGQNNTQSSFSYDYAKNDTINTSGTVIDEKPKKKKRVFTKVIAFAVCAAVISAGSISAYKYIDDNFSFENFFGRGTSDSSEADLSSKEASKTNSNASNEKSLIELASREDSLSVPDAVSKVMPAVVGISSEFQVNGQSMGGNWFFGNQGQTNTQVATATGTGIVMTSEGYIITNAHVIYDNNTDTNYGKATGVSVLMSDETEYEATIIGYDTDTDIAVLKIDASGLIPAEFGNSDDLQVGELVLAIGNPLGFELFGSVTSGIVSALNREININDKKMNLIQTDAAINSGNSGGPLINSYGQVIGINSAKMTSTYSSASVEGLGFAIPITQAKTIIDDLINYGYVKGRPQLGITCIDVDESTARLYNMPVGAYVRSVTPNGAAALAGIQEGDIIIGVNGTAVSTADELSEKKNEFNAGDTITLTISRNGKDTDIQVTLQEVTQGDTLFGNQETVEN